MGIDLKLIPYEDRGAISGSSVVLPLNRCTDLWDTIRATCETVPVPEDFYSFMSRCEECGERHYGPSIDDGYGEPLRATTAGELVRLKDHEGVQRFDNRPAWAYLEALKPSTPVALYWD